VVWYLIHTCPNRLLCLQYACRLSLIQGPFDAFSRIDFLRSLAILGLGNHLNQFVVPLVLLRQHLVIPSVLRLQELLCGRVGVIILSITLLLAGNHDGLLGNLLAILIPIFIVRGSLLLHLLLVILLIFWSPKFLVVFLLFSDYLSEIVIFSLLFLLFMLLVFLLNNRLIRFL
jgi:hypothetical protein